MKSIMIAALVLVVIFGTATITMAATTDPFGDKSSVIPVIFTNQVVDKNVSFSFEQSVQGNGYFMTYKYAKMGNVEFKDYAHGSGSLDNEAILTSYNSSHKAHLWNADWNDYDVNCIQYKETTHAVYAPTRIAIGNGYYAANPLIYDSLIKEKTWVKNRLAGTSMQNEVEYAHKLDKDLSVLAKDFTDFTYDPLFKSNAVTQMTIKEDVGEGKTHIGVLQANSDGSGRIPTSLVSMATTAWKKPAVEIDEDYFGTFHVEKNMTLSVPYTRNKPTYDWLPCSCTSGATGGIGGWNDMFPTDQKAHSAKGFFDCTTCWPNTPCKN